MESVADSDSARALSHEDSADSSNLKCGVEEAASTRTQSLRVPAAGARPHSGSTGTDSALPVAELDPASRVALQRALATTTQASSHRVLPQAAAAVTSGSGGSAMHKALSPTRSQGKDVASSSSLPAVLSPGRAPPSRPVAAQAQTQAVVAVAVTPSESSPPKPPTLDGDSEESEFLFRQLFRSSPEL